LSLDGANVTGTVTLANTGGWNNWVTLGKSGVNLAAGTHVLRLAFDAAAVTGTDLGDVNWVQFTASSTGGSVPTAPGNLAGRAVNGKLYVFGGYTNTSIEATARSDVYDPVTNAWRRLPDMPQALTHSGQAIDGRFIYLVGGFLGDHPGPGVSSFWIFDTVGEQ